jgi:hypothetical protein
MNPPFIPQTLDELTPEWLTTTLRAEGVLERACIRNYTSESLSGVGLIASVDRLTLTYDRDEPGAPPTLISKMPTTHFSTELTSMSATTCVSSGERHSSCKQGVLSGKLRGRDCRDR